MSSAKPVNLQKRAAPLVCLVAAVAAVLCFLFQTEVQIFGKSYHDEARGATALPQKNPTGMSFPEDYRFLIKVLTYNRLDSLARCLQSLAAADYEGDSVKLHIFVDHFRIEESMEINKRTAVTKGRNAAVAQGQELNRGKKKLLLEGSKERERMNSSYSELFLSEGAEEKSRRRFMEADVVDTIHKKLKEAHDILHYIDTFVWPHGHKEVHYRTQNAGLQAQWLEAWWPASDNEFAFIVEDDMQLSPLFYRYLRRIIATYYFEPANFDSSIYGISLQRPRFVPGRHGNRLRVDNNTRLFLYQMVGTWGQLLFPRPWKEFRFWYDVHKSKGVKPLLEGMVITSWYHRMGEKIWTPWFTQFVHSKSYFNLYTNFLDERALSISNRDEGVNTKRQVGPDSKLIGADGASDIDLWEMKSLKDLKRYDYCFQEVVQGRLVSTFDRLRERVASLQVDGNIILVSALGLPEVLVRNWLCQFSKLGIKNYLLLLQDRKLATDLLRRGHAVVCTDLGRDKRDVDLIGLLKDENIRWIKFDLVTVQAVRRILQLGCSLWLTEVDTSWLENPFHHISETDADVIGVGAREQLMTGFVYFKSSKNTIQLWQCVREEIIHGAKSLGVAQASQYRKGNLGKVLWQCLAKVKVKVNLVSASLISQMSTVPKSQNNSLTLPAPLVSGIQTSDFNTTMLSLKNLGVWLVDDDFACTGVYCKARTNL